jgi:hypothetical protein
MIPSDNNFHAYLCETDVDGSFPEALTADVEAVLANETSIVRADAAIKDYPVSVQSFSKSPK